MAKKVKVTVVKREKTIESLPVIGSQGVPVFHFDYVDKDGKFAFNPGRSDFKHKEVLQKIIDFSKLTWNEVLSHSTSSRRNSKHHNLSADKLCKDARERLAKISLDESLLIQIDEILEEISVRLMADSQEETIDGNIKLLLVGLTHVAN